MRMILRSHRRQHVPASPPAPRTSADARRDWIVALFGAYLPRSGERRDSAIAALAEDGEVWRMLHQARHSMSETNATIERLAASANARFESLRAA